MISKQTTQTIPNDDANPLQTPCETVYNMLSNPEYVEAWRNNPILQKYTHHMATVKNTAATDERSMVNELSAMVLGYGRAKTPGRDLCNVYMTDKEIFRIPLSSEGEAFETKEDAYVPAVKGQRRTYLEIRPDRYLYAGDSWNRSYIEDSSWNVMQSQMEEVAHNLRRKETEIVLAELKKLQSVSGIAGKVGRTGDDSTMKVDTLVRLRGKITAKNYEPNIVVMGEDLLTELLSDNTAQDSTFFQSRFYDEATGMTSITFLNMRILSSTLVPAATAYCIDSNHCLALVLRRDELVQSWEDRQHNKFGITASNRFNLKQARKEAFAWYGA